MNTAINSTQKKFLVWYSSRSRADRRSGRSRSYARRWPDSLVQLTAPDGDKALSLRRTTSPAQNLAHGKAQADGTARESKGIRFWTLLVSIHTPPKMTYFGVRLKTFIKSDITTSCSLGPVAWFMQNTACLRKPIIGLNHNSNEAI